MYVCMYVCMYMYMYMFSLSLSLSLSLSRSLSLTHTRVRAQTRYTFHCGLGCRVISMGLNLGIIILPFWKEQDRDSWPS